jgi:hypothetical protein
MGNQLFENNALATLGTTTLSDSATTIVLSASLGDQFPAPTGDDFFLGTLFELDVSGNEINFEIVKVTARAADSLTVVRNFEPIDGAPRAYPSVDNPSEIIYFALRWTSYPANNMLAKDDNLASLTDPVAARENLGVEIDVDVQAYSAMLSAFAALATNGIVKRTGAGAAAIIAIQAFIETFLTAADATAARAALGLVIGTNVQGYDAELAAIAGLTSAANKLPYFTGSGTASLADLTAFARTLLDDADAAAARATLAAAGTGVAQTFTAPQTAGDAALTHNTAWDGAAKQQLTVNVNGSSFTIANPTGATLKAKTYYAIYVTYTTAHTIAFGSNFKGIGSLAPTAVAGAKDHFIFRSDDTGTNLELVAAAYDIGA